MSENVIEEEQLELFPDAFKLKEKQELNNKKDLINPWTGEVFHQRSQVVVGSYCDNTINVEPSLTDESDYEDINDTIARCGRRRLIDELESQEAKLAKENGLNNPTFDDYDETEDADYDYVDAKQTLNEFEEKLKSAKQVQNSSASEDKQSANEQSTNSGEQADNS